QRLGDLELQAVRIETGIAENGRYALREASAIAQLARRNVDGHLECRVAGLVPGSTLPAGRDQRPFSERRDEPGLLGNRDEAGRRHHAADGVTPAGQRLDPDNLAAVVAN